jgi:hypothetical protein
LFAVVVSGWAGWAQPRRRGRAIRLGGAGRLGDGPDLVPGDGFLLEQGGGELGEGLPAAGEQVPGAGFRFGQQGGGFLVGQRLGVLGAGA